MGEQLAQSGFRIRCEGQLEVLELAAVRYRSLAQALRTGDWDAFSRFPFDELARSCTVAERTLARQGEDEGEGRAALASVAGARAELQGELVRRARQLQIPSNGALRELAERVRGALPIRFDGTVGLEAPARELGFLLQLGRTLLGGALGWRVLTLAFATYKLVSELYGPYVNYQMRTQPVALRIFEQSLEMMLVASALGLLVAVTGPGSRLAAAFRRAFSRPVWLALTKDSLVIGRRQWPIQTIARVLAERDREARLVVSFKDGRVVELTGRALEGLLTALEDAGVLVEIRTSPTQPIEELKKAALLNQRLAPARPVSSEDEQGALHSGVREPVRR